MAIRVILGFVWVLICVGLAGLFVQAYHRDNPPAKEPTFEMRRVKRASRHDICAAYRAWADKAQDASPGMEALCLNVLQPLHE